MQGRPFGARPFGARPFGARPFGARPFGARPFGARSYDDEEEAERPFGARPFGARPFGARPFGARPFGVRPFGARAEGEDLLDADDWSADVAELVLERSAVVRLGATVVGDEYELRVPAADATANAPDYVKEGEEKPRLDTRELTLRPRDHELAAKVALPDRLARDIARNPVLALAVKEDLAEALALRADLAFLQGAAPLPIGIANQPGVVGVPAGADALATARALLAALQTVDPLLNPPFRAPGWIVHPASLSALLQTKVGAPGATVDMVHSLLRSNGADTGHLLGYPMVVTAAASIGNARALFFSADWREAWIGIDDAVVRVDVSTESHFQTDETVIRATMAHDFVLRRPGAFAFARATTPSGRARRSASRSTTSSRSRRSSGG